jgi:hypothetical protein
LRAYRKNFFRGEIAKEKADCGGAFLEGDFEKRGHTKRGLFEGEARA